MQTRLSRDVLYFQQTGQGWKSIINEILLLVYRYPVSKNGWKEEECSGFLLAYYPRIPGMIRRYQPRSSFEVYLNNGLYWFMRTYRERLKNRKYYEVWAASPVRVEYDNCRQPGVTLPLPPEQPHFPQAANNSPAARPNVPRPPEVRERAALPRPGLPRSGTASKAAPPLNQTGLFATDKQGRFISTALRRRILYLALLHASELNDEQIENAARLSGSTPAAILQHIQAVQKLTSDRLERKCRLTERRNECWYKLEQARYRSRLEENAPEHIYKDWQRKTRTWERRYQLACEGLRRAKPQPFHSEIGRILNTPTGTVSAGLHLLKKAWREIQEDSP